VPGRRTGPQGHFRGCKGTDPTLPGARPRSADFFAALAGAFDRGSWSFEDVDLAERVRDVGIQVVVAAQSVEGLGDHRQAARLLAPVGIAAAVALTGRAALRAGSVIARVQKNQYAASPPFPYLREWGGPFPPGARRSSSPNGFWALA
jgi:hypothetical protein